MGKFTGKWAIEEYGPYLAKATAELSYIDNMGITHTVEIGFITDGASIPPIAWSFIGSPFTGLYRKPALVHDEGYDSQKYKRNYIDRIFLEGMKDEGVSLWKRRVMWGYVRALGWHPWNKQAKKLKKLKED